MTTTRFRSSELWALVRRQHGVVTRQQLLAHGLTDAAIRHRLATVRLYPLRSGVYAVGRAEVPRKGALLAAVLACGSDAALSHASAAELWEMRPRSNPIHVSVPEPQRRRGPGLVVHRRAIAPATTTRHGIPVTTPLWTLVDLAATLDREPLEAAINAADRQDLVDPEQLRRGLNDLRRVPGAAALRTLLDRRTFVLTESALERLFLPIARRAGLSTPETRTYENSFRVDFIWAELGLIVETDGLRYHRTPAQQKVDRVRDQTHTAAGRTPLRFTHEQVRYEPDYVERILTAVARRLLLSV